MVNTINPFSLSYFPSILGGLIFYGINHKIVGSYHFLFFLSPLPSQSNTFSIHFLSYFSLIFFLTQQNHLNQIYPKCHKKWVLISSISKVFYCQIRNLEFESHLYQRLIVFFTKNKKQNAIRKIDFS